MSACELAVILSLFAAQLVLFVLVVYRAGKGGF